VPSHDWCQAYLLGDFTVIRSIAIALLGLSFLMAKSPQRVVSPPDNMIVDGVPSIQHSPKAEKKLGLYVESAAATLMDWSRTDRTMLIKMDSGKGNSRQLFDLAVPMGQPKQRGRMSDEATASLWQPQKKSMMVVQKDVDGKELWQNFRVDPDTNALTLLSDGKSRNGYPVWGPKGDKIAFCAMHRGTTSYTGICTVDPADPSTLNEIAQLPGASWDDVNDWSPDGKYLLAVSGDIAFATRIILVNAKTGQKEDVTPSERKAVYWPIGFTSDSHGILLATNLDSEFSRLAYMDIESKALVFLTPDTWDVDAYFLGDYEWPALSSDRKWLAFAMNEDGRSTLHILNVDKKAVRKLPTPGSGLVRNLHWNGNNKEFAFNLVSNQSLGDIYSINIQTNKTERWTKLGSHALDLNKNVTPTLIKWKAFDQREISGWLYRPPTTFQGKRPVIIDIHGGPTDQFRPAQLAGKNYFINELGIAMIFPNIRGSVGYGKTFRDLDNGFKREDAFSDIVRLLDWIKLDPTLDASRVMISGGSYGGYMAFTMATKVSDRVACFVASWGPTNLVTMINGTTPELGLYLVREFGDPQDPKTKAFLVSISPSTNANKIKSPMLVVAGVNDPRVPIEQSDSMVAAIKAQGGPTWYLRAGNEGHGFQRKDNLGFETLVTIAFVQKYLLKDGRGVADLGTSSK
jgi:dipeptidyl aminopeptidase/acylaminoacyl peptidase